MKLYEKFVTEELNEDNTLKSLKFHAPSNFNFGYDVVDEWAKTNPDKKAMIWVADDETEIWLRLL